MKRLPVLIVMGISLGFLAGRESGPLSLTWLGHSCFILHSAGGTEILMDPFDKGVGYSAPSVKVNAVTISHEHFDHNNAAMAEGKPEVIRGLTDKSCAQVDRTVGDVHIRSVCSHHFDKDHPERGLNAVMIFETGGKTVVHLGDLGRQLTAEQVKAIGRVDVLLLPVGGVYTIDAAGATQVMEVLKPKLVIPMHYKTAKCRVNLSPVDPFLQGKPRVEKKKSSTLEIQSLPAETTIVVLEPRQ